MQNKTGRIKFFFVIMAFAFVTLAIVIVFVLKKNPITVAVSSVKVESVFRGYENLFREKLGDNYFSDQMSMYFEESKTDGWRQWLWEGELPSSNPEEYICLTVELTGKNRFVADYFREGALIEKQGDSRISVVTTEPIVAPEEYSRLKTVSYDRVSMILYIGECAEEEILAAVRDIELQLCFRKESGEQLVVPLSLEGTKELVFSRSKQD